MKLVFDFEANALLEDVSVLHCMADHDLVTGVRQSFTPLKVEHGLRRLMQADLVIGHNVIKYDLPVANKLYPWFAIDRAKVIDTLVLSRLIFSDLSDQDRSNRAKIDAKLYGSHSLKAWGQRLGIHKGDYTGGFDEYSPEMLAYNEQDVEVTTRLYEMLIKHPAYSERASVLEHSVAHIVAQQERYGFTFDVAAAERLSGELIVRRMTLEQNLQDTFKPWVQDVGLFTPKVNNTLRGYVKGVPVMKTKTVEFNPGSRHHIANRLKAMRDWKPIEFTSDGSAKIDETILLELPYPEAKLISQYLMVQKRIGMVCEGDGAWLKKARCGKIHGEMITNGAVTGRATHKNPNIGQVPSVGSEYGKECRALFGPSKGRVQVGIDVSGLELRMLAHFMHRYDNGRYATEVVTGDVHTANQLAAGLETRDQAKTFIYAFLYGAGPQKIGSIVGKGAVHGKKLKDSFLRRTPALARLLFAIKDAARRGYLIGLDGRRVRVRSGHSAPNTLLQCAGALVCKEWMTLLDEAIIAWGWQDKCQQLAWVHDELQFESDADIADELGKLAVACIAQAGENFKIKLPLTGEYKVGQNWCETH